MKRDMTFAIIQNGGKQYLVKPGDEVRLEKQPSGENGLITFNEVLLWQNGDELKLGQPTIAGATVTGRVIASGRGPKIPVIKFKSKTGYRQKKSHRQPYLAVKIEQINHGH